jgi:hypothetical protein
MTVFNQKALHAWNEQDHCQHLPPLEKIAPLGKRKWEQPSQDISRNSATVEISGKIFTMPGFAHYGRWGNMVFQYLFMDALAANNDASIELNREEESLAERLNLYTDLANISPVKTQADNILIDSFHLFFGWLNYFPPYFWRAIYVSKILGKKCFILNDAKEAITQPIVVAGNAVMEVEGLFVVNPKLYAGRRELILNKLLQPTPTFNAAIENCMNNLGRNKTIIGIHIRRGDFVREPLEQGFQIPVATKYIVKWLSENLAAFHDPVIYVCSDDSNAFKEIESAGFKVLTSKHIMPETDSFLQYEQLDWEILRRCNVIINSNSTFSFSTSLLNRMQPVCYRFSFKQKKFISFDPWQAEPLEFYTSAPYLWSFLYSRFSLVTDMVNTSAAKARLKKDLKKWIHWKSTKFSRLRYKYGFSARYYFRLLNFFEFFQLSTKNKSCLDYDKVDKIRL